MLSGGHVDSGDRSPETALSREINEEIGRQDGHRQPAASAGIRSRAERQYFYLGRIASSGFAARTRPEFTEAGRGIYQLEQIPLTAAGLGAIDLQPAAAAGLLRDALAVPEPIAHNDESAAAASIG